MKTFTMSKVDRYYLENKYHKTSEPFDSFNRMAHHGYEYDEATGLSDEAILEGLKKLTDDCSCEPHALIKAKAVAYVLDNTRIDINEHDYYFGVYSWNRLIARYTVKTWHDEVCERAKKDIGSSAEVELSKTGTVYIGLDFDHTVPDWDSLSTLGFKGVLERAEKCYMALCEKGNVTEKQKNVFEAVKIEYEAILRFVERLYKYSLTKKFEKSEKISKCLKTLCHGAPTNTYEMLYLMFIYFMISESIDHYQVRSLGYGLDNTLYPFYKHDIENGTFTKEEISDFIAYFFMQFSAIGSHWGQPLYLGGTNPDGSTKINELTYLILDIYEALDIYNPKLQLKINKNTPEEFIKRTLDMVRTGTNSMVFVNEDVVTAALMKNGATYEEALDSVIKGCYEYTTKGDCIGISFNTYNALKPVSLVLNRGVDTMTGIKVGIDTGDISAFKTFGEFYRAYIKQFKYIIDKSLMVLDSKEKYINEVNPSTIYSATIEKCMENMTDAIDCGVKNVSNVLLNGLASAVDSLMAVYELVFEKKITTLDELHKALLANWKGYENLRAKALLCKHKFGVGDKMSDSYANAIHLFFSSQFSGRRNCHGGNYEYELHSARMFLDQGRETEATPDGRIDGQETSKNLSPTMGMDKKGITALINSATTLDLSLADSGACLDVMLHPSSVAGDDGLIALRGILMTYINKGGASVHFNIFDTNTLIDAQEHPENYKNLQVRMSGWNVLWNNMSKVEQDTYILRSKNII